MELKFEWDEEKDRYIAIGMVGDLLFVVFTERRENIRLISARLGGFIMTKTFTIKDGQVPTQEQLEEVRAAAKREIQP